MKEDLARRIKNGEHIAFYCYGIYASYLLLYLRHFYNVLPVVVIDNDRRKKGVAEFGVPVMPYEEAKRSYTGLKYFICSDDFKYTIIGNLLEKGERADDIINYVPVEKRRSCLYFYNRLLLCQGKGTDGSHLISHCNADSFKKQGFATRFHSTEKPKGKLDKIFEDFEQGRIDVCNHCVMNREQYIVDRKYKKHYKQLAFYQESCSDCLSHCVYCCVGGNLNENKNNPACSSLESYFDFAKEIFLLNCLDDDFSCAIDMSERDIERKIFCMVQSMENAGIVPMLYKVNSCHISYSPTLSKLMRNGMAYTVWSLDAGTAETYRKIKKINAFECSIENVKKYIEEDAFHGAFIVAKSLIVKGINDNDEEFDAFLELVERLNLKFVSLSYDFYAEANEKDLQFIRKCYNKLLEHGLKLTYKNNSKQVTEALDMENILSQ